MTERIPKPLPLPPGRTIQSYPLLPVDGFVLSRIDGSSREQDLATFTGLDPSAIEESLARLASLGLVERTGLPEPEPLPELEVVLEPGAPDVENAPELQEEVDIDLDHRKRILIAFARLPELNHYELLEIERDAEKKAVKKKYYELAAVFHPDRFFRKKLGSFKPKMELVFSRITEAHDTLSNAERRAEYDEYLGDQAQSSQIERQIAIAAPPPDMIATPPRPISAGVVVSEVARRDALARRLLGGRSRISSPPPVSDPDALKRHYEQRVTFAKVRVLNNHLEAARSAMAKNDAVNAVNFFKLALEVDKDNAEVQAELAEAQSVATEILADTYRRQAKYEEKNEQWEAAARNWAKLAKARDKDAGTQNRAAAAYLRAGTKLHEAAAFGVLATKLEPEKAQYRVTLAQVYAAAGLTLNARREIEAAARLAPDDANIQALVKTLGKK